MTDFFLRIALGDETLWRLCRFPQDIPHFRTDWFWYDIGQPLLPLSGITLQCFVFFFFFKHSRDLWGINLTQWCAKATLHWNWLRFPLNSVQWHHVCNLKLTMVWVFMPQKEIHFKNNSFFSFIFFFSFCFVSWNHLLANNWTKPSS